MSNDIDANGQQTTQALHDAAVQRTGEARRAALHRLCRLRGPPRLRPLRDQRLHVCAQQPCPARCLASPCAAICAAALARAGVVMSVADAASVADVAELHGLAQHSDAVVACGHQQRSAVGGTEVLERRGLCSKALAMHWLAAIRASGVRLWRHWRGVSARAAGSCRRAVVLLARPRLRIRGVDDANAANTRSLVHSAVHKVHCSASECSAGRGGDGGERSEQHRAAGKRCGRLEVDAVH